MYGWDTLVLLQHLLDEGLSKTAIAARLGVSRRAIYHWIATGQLTRDVDAPVPRTSRSRTTKLDRFKDIITARLTTYPELSAVRLFAEVQAAGYTGGITQLRDYVAIVRPRPEPEPLVRFETPPGRQAQVDFAEFRFAWGKRYALLVVLGYSRLLWLKFYPRQTMAGSGGLGPTDAAAKILGALLQLLTTGGILGVVTAIVYHVAISRASMENLKRSVVAELARLREENNRNTTRIEAAFDRHIDTTTEHRVRVERWQAQTDSAVDSLEGRVEQLEAEDRPGRYQVLDQEAA